MTRQRSHRSAFDINVTALLVLASGSAAAQQEPQRETGVLQEIIVTASKRSENLQDVPISISAVTGEELAKRGVVSLNELGSAVSGLAFIGQASVLAKIRGVGNNDNTAGNENSVAVYVDDVYQATIYGFMRKMSNVEQIEVAKGPQGTLFGRNALGGVINIKTKDPTQELTGNVSLGYADYETMSAESYLSGGLTDNLAANLSLYYYDQGEGWGTNLFTGNEVYKTRDMAARTKWLYTPNDASRILLALDYSRADGSGLNVPHTLDGFATNNVTGGPPFLAPGIDEYDVTSFWDPDGELEQYGASLRIEHEFGFADFLSITAYRRYNTDLLIPPDIPLATQLTHWIEEDDAWTQEFQLTSNSTGKFEWTAGIFLMDAEQGYPELSFVGALVSPLAKLDLGPTFEKTESWAGFGQVTVPLSASGRTRLTLGGRYTSDKRHLIGKNVRTFANGTTVEANQNDVERTFSKATYRVVLDHRLTDDVLGYVSFNRGFKSGLFSTTSLRPNNATPYVRPEIMDAYEVGLKNELFDRRLRLNVSGYYYDYTDLQVQIRGTTSTSITNGAKAEIYGVDLDVEAVVTDRLTLTATVSKSDNSYEEFPSAPLVFVEPITIGGNRIVAGDAAGKNLNYAPELTWGASATYAQPTSIGDLTFSASYSYSDGWFNTPDNTLETADTQFVGAQIGWTSTDGKHGLILYGNNLGDERRITQLNRGGNPGGFNYAGTYAPPRMIGMTYRYQL